MQELHACKRLKGVKLSMLRIRTDTLLARAKAAGDTCDSAIARRSGIQQSTISRLRAGQTTPSVHTLVALGRAYAISLDDLVDTTEAAA